MSTTPTDATTDRRAWQKREARAKTLALRVPCGCGAPAGVPCDRELSKARVIHASRVLDAVKAEAKP